MTVIERAVPGSPSRTDLSTAAFSSGVPAPTAASFAGSNPKSSGLTSYESNSSLFSSTTRVGPATENSSRPSALDTTNALSVPRARSACPIGSITSACETPITWRVAPAGFVSGPRKLKTVRTASALRTGTTCRIAWWWSGANMKPKPAPSMQSATCSGPRSIRAPSASSTSAEPQRLVAERLPCLATRQPAPAATSAAVVDTLKVGRPPPVPAVSTRPSPASTGTASSRIARASPVISSTVSPLVRRAIRNAAVWASEASPDMISWSTRAASSADRASRPATRSIASVSTGLRHARKLRSRALPCSVSTDSGWNCTPSAGSSRWRSPITTSPANAERSRQSGRSGSTTSEW